MKHTIATNNGGRVVVTCSADLKSVVLGINGNQHGAASVRLDAATLGAVLMALEMSAEDCGMDTTADAV